MIPGVERTAGAASRDYGLIGGQRLAERGAAAPDFSARHAANNAAITKELQRLGANSDNVKNLEKAREKFTKPMRDAALDNATGPVDYQPVAAKIIELASSAEGGRAASRNAREWLVKEIEVKTKDGRLDARNAYALEKDIGELVAGKVTSDKGSLRLAAGLANEVKKVLSQQIEAVAPILNLWFINQPVTQTIERVGELAVALGADPEDPQVVADREAFLAAETGLKAAIAAKPGLKVAFASGTPDDAFYIGNPNVNADLIYFASLGLDIVAPEDQSSFFEKLSWEEAGRYPVDLLIMDDRQWSSTPEELIAKVLNDPALLQSLAAAPKPQDEAGG